MSQETENQLKDETLPTTSARRVAISEEQAVTLVEGLATVTEYLWADELRHYNLTEVDERAGHVFEHLMRLKAIANSLRYEISIDRSAEGACPYCRGNDGRYLYDGQFWGFCQLCHCRWHLGSCGQASVWPHEQGAEYCLIHQLFQEVVTEERPGDSSA